ncbi:hypothetical protein AAVH_28120 [Aphelenchoides avenae]|nr:hypothetical protein AAVH_28120 [Aphelenchus avenae]
MVTGKGREIGKDAPLLQFIPSTDHEGKDFKFLDILDYIDPQGCDDPVDERHYLIQWEVDGEPQSSWTHCTNIDDHLCGLQNFYSDVTRVRVADAIREYEELLPKKQRRIAFLKKKVRMLTKERDEALARAASPTPIADENPGVTNGAFDDPSVEVDLFPRGGTSASAGAKRGFSPSWVAPSGSAKLRRTSGDFASPVRTGSRLADASDFERAYLFGSQLSSRTSSRASTASETGRAFSLPEWIDTTGWHPKRINATTRAFRKLRANHAELSEDDFKVKVLKHVADMEKRAEE